MAKYINNMAELEKALMGEMTKMVDEIAERVSKSRTSVTNSMRLLKLDQRVQQMLIDEMISEGHGRALLPITDPEEQFTLAMKVFDEKMSVRETEKMVQSYINPKTKSALNTRHTGRFSFL